MSHRYLVKSSTVTCTPDNTCKDTTRFFSNLAEKLKQMAISIEDRINRIQENSCQVVKGATLFASIEAPVMTLGVKYEYIEYIKRYGPPSNGIFNLDILTILRQELGIQESDYVI